MTVQRCPRCGTRLIATRYPLDPLTALYPGDSLHKTCERLGLSGSTLKGYMCHGVLVDTADRIAARAGVSAYSVWPEMVDDAIAAIERECAAEDCDARFVGHPNRRYCSSSCKRRIEARRQRARYPEKELARTRAWKERNAETYREYNRRYQRRYMAELRRRQREDAA